ncbi:hypothetical protein PHYSODRAFT_374834, partial [Phytophthora sojae]
LSGGKTSKATYHLSSVHSVISDKTALETTRKRAHYVEISRIQAPALCRGDAKRLGLLLETMRIVNPNLPFCFGEYPESHVIKNICTTAEFQATVNSHTATHSIVELYAAGLQEVVGFLRDNRVGGMPCFVAVAEFYSSKHTGNKYLGFRVYLIDAQFQFKSILLGARHFRPQYGEHCFGATTVKWMMTQSLHLQWERCIPHLVNAGTKNACGMTRNSNNVAMSELINRISRTIFQVHRTEKMDDLMEQVMLLLGKGNSTTLVAYNRAGSWDLLAIRERQLEIPIDFPLINDKVLLEQILSLLAPIELVNMRAQSESANQVDVLPTLYALQTSVL